MPDSTNDNKSTWFTLGVATEIDQFWFSCEKKISEEDQKPLFEDFKAAYPGIPDFLGHVEGWTASRINKVTCEDFAKYIAQPPNGEEILDRGQDWPVGDPDPCNSWERENNHGFWFKHL